MNYDKILGNYFLTRSLFIKAKFTGIKYRVNKTPSEKCYVLVSGWQMKLVNSFLLENKLRKDNYLVIEMPDATISSDPLLTVKIIKRVKKLAQKKIKSFKKQGVKEFVLISASLGTVVGTILLNEDEDLKKAIMISPSNSISEAFWDGIETQVLRKIYELEGFNRKKLYSTWKSIHPENNMSNFEGKNLTIHLSESDLIVPYKGGKEYVKKAKASGAKVKVIKNKKLGHLLTISKDYILRKAS